MNTERISIRYARALLDAAKPNNLENTVFNDIILVGNYIKHSHELKNLIKSPIIKSTRKKSVFNELFASKIHSLTLNFLNLLADKNREELIPDIINQYKKIFYKEQGVQEVFITTANELDETIKQKIEEVISKNINSKIIAHYHIDKSIKGGIKVQIEDLIYDASLSTLLNKLYHKLVSAN